MTKKFSKRGALEISFPWLFAIVAGIFILFLAIYGVTRFIKTEQTTIDAKTGKEIGVLLNPLETSFESGAVTFFVLPVSTRIYNKCDSIGDFGKQGIQISQMSFNKWTETNVNVNFQNKYIFSKDYAEGKKFYVFSKPFQFPFKVADLMYMTSSLERYCFEDAPGEISEELVNLNQENILVENCSEEDIDVCFGGINCDINVNYEMGVVEKGGDSMYFYGDALMYAAIFSDEYVYECQLNRLMKRVSSLALIYNDKASFISRTGCYSNLDLSFLSGAAESFSNSADISSIGFIADDVGLKNDANSVCRLW